jgi:hypothetical protein
MSPSTHPPDTHPSPPGEHPKATPPQGQPTWLTHQVLEVLRRHPGTALPLERVRECVEREGTPVPGRADHFADSLARDPDHLHLLLPRRRSGDGPAPGPWVLARTPVGLHLTHPILHLLRETLRLLGQAVDPESNMEMARWERYLMEEAEVHQAMKRRRPRDRGGRQPSTTPLPDPLPGTGILRPRRPRAASRPRPAGSR